MDGRAVIEQLLSGLIGIAVGVVLVPGYYWLRYGVIERHWQGRRNVAMIDAAMARFEQSARRSTPITWKDSLVLADGRQLDDLLHVEPDGSVTAKTGLPPFRKETWS